MTPRCVLDPMELPLMASRGLQGVAGVNAELGFGMC